MQTVMAIAFDVKEGIVGDLAVAFEESGERISFEQIFFGQLRRICAISRSMIEL